MTHTHRFAYFTLSLILFFAYLPSIALSSASFQARQLEKGKAILKLEQTHLKPSRSSGTQLKRRKELNQILETMGKVHEDLEVLEYLRQTELMLQHAPDSFKKVLQTSRQQLSSKRSTWSKFAHIRSSPENVALEREISALERKIIRIEGAQSLRPINLENQQAFLKEKVKESKIPSQLKKVENFLRANISTKQPIIKGKVPGSPKKVHIVMDDKARDTAEIQLQEYRNLYHQVATDSSLRSKSFLPKLEGVSPTPIDPRWDIRKIAYGRVYPAPFSQYQAKIAHVVKEGGPLQASGFTGGYGGGGGGNLQTIEELQKKLNTAPDVPIGKDFRK